MLSGTATLCFAKMILFTFCILFWSLPVLSTAGVIPDEAHVRMTTPSDVIIGALLPLHDWSAGPPCTGPISKWGNELVAVLLYAVENINQRNDLLPNITIGVDVRDNCYSETLSIWSALALASTSERPQKDIEFKKVSQPGARGNLFCIIGSQSSPTSIPTAQAASLYRIPVISPFATSDELSDKARFPYFLRTVPSDSLRVSAIADILLHYGWLYVGLFFELNTYGMHGAQALLDIAEKQGICVAFSVPVRKQASETELYDAVERLTRFQKMSVVVIIGDEELAGPLIRTISKVIPLSNITYVGSGAWAYPKALTASGVPPSALQGTITVQVKFTRMEGIQEYYNSLQQQDPYFSPWFGALKEQWLKENKCSDIADCPIQGYSNDVFLVDAVYAFAYALQDMLDANCNASAECNSSTLVDSITGHDFLPYLLNVDFQGLAGRYIFDANGNPGGSYKIQTFQLDGDVIRTVDVGNWSTSSTSSSDRLFINTSAIQWIHGRHDPPTSICRDACQPGYIEVPLEEKCCYGCQQCPRNAVVMNNSCTDCPIDEWPDKAFEVCRPITPTPPSWTEPIVIIILIISGIGLILCILAAIGLVYYRDHVLIQAANPELSSINILGLTLAFLSPFPLLVSPTVASCRASEIIIAICFTLIYAPTLLKVNRIYRIYDAGKKSKKRPRFIDPRTQMAIALGIITGMIVIALTGALVSFTGPTKLVFYPPANYLEVYCKFGIGFLLTLLCNLLLVLACCYYAFKARKVPSNYNESKFIAVSVYSMLVFGVAAVPVYVTAAAVLQKIATLCVAILLSAFLTLCCVYLPKLYAIQLGRDVKVCEWESNDTGSMTAGSITASNATTPTEMVLEKDC